MSFKEETVRDIRRLERKICCLNGNINDLLSEDIIAALEGANAPGAGNVFLTALDGGVGGSNIQVEANYAALPDPTTVTGEFYWAESSQGTQWLPGSLGGTYYPLGIYYSNGVSWTHIESPYQATLVTVNAALNDNQFVTPYTFDNADKWTTKADVGHIHPISDITDLQTILDSLVESGEAVFFFEDENDPIIAGYKVMDNPAQLLAVAYVTESTIVDTQIIQEWITDIGLPNVTFIPNGVWVVHMNAYKTGGTKDVRIYNDIYKRDLAGTETLLGTTANSIALTGVEVPLTFNIYIPDVVLLETDRIVTKTRIRLIGGGSNPTSVTIGYSGTTAARLSIPVQALDLTSITLALATKVDENVAIVGATKTKITYDTKGLVTSGADATTADIADSLDKRYVTDAQLALIGASSGGGTMMVLGSDYANTNPNVTYGAWDFAVTNAKKYRVEISGYYVTTNNAHRARITLSGVTVAASSHVQMFINLGGTSNASWTSHWNYGSTLQIDSGSGSQTTTVHLPFTTVFYFTASASGIMNVTLGTTAGVSGPSVSWKSYTSMIIQEF